MGPIVAVTAFVMLAIAIPIVVSYFVDRSVHDGVDWFRRRSVMQSGASADASILSSTIVVGKPTGARNRFAYSVVYEVRPAGVKPFRAKAIEVMYASEAYYNRLDAGQVVRVCFDPQGPVVVLVRVDPKSQRRIDDERRREKEAALLRGE